MFIVTINGLDSSCHTLELDAQAQRQRYIDSGISEAIVGIIEKNNFEPVQH